MENDQNSAKDRRDEISILLASGGVEPTVIELPDQNPVTRSFLSDEELAERRASRSQGQEQRR